jgi:pullulanase
VECHDNGTFYDKLVRLYPTAPEETLQAYIRFSLSVVLLSQGIPFLHMAQEVGGSKFGDHNSYKSGDVVNQFHYERLPAFADVVSTLKDLISLRKQHAVFRQPFTMDADQYTIQRLDNGIFTLTLTHQNDTYLLGVNPTSVPFPVHLTLNNPIVLFDGQRLCHTPFTTNVLPPLSVLVLKQS